MKKAVFIDYTGTTIEEGGRDMQELVMRVCGNSDLHEPGAVIALWWRMLKSYEDKSYGENYLTEDEIVDCLLHDLKEQIHLSDNPAELHELIRRFWMYAPIFEDAKIFFEKCPLPIYIISNNGVLYVEEAMKDKGLKPEGIICADMVKAYKPYRELFDKALEVSGCKTEETVHIGDSYESDVQGARSAGIEPILIDRKGTKAQEGVRIVRSLEEVLELL